MGQLPEGRKPLLTEWFVDRAKRLQDDKDLSQQIRGMTPEERNRAKEREITYNMAWHKCVSCGNDALSDFCGFCLEEE